MRIARCLLPVAVLAAALSMRATAMAAQDTIPPGTVITVQNWQQYKQFMSVGLQALFSGQYFWKLPPDFQAVIGPPLTYTPPKEYVANTEKYASQVRIVNLPDGGHSITGYVAGRPFPNPAPPMKGYKILVDEWYRFLPWLNCGKHNWNHFKDRFGNISTNSFILVYRMLSHISGYGQPIDDPSAQGIFYSEYLMLTTPEQSRYLVNLTLYYVDPTKPEDVYLFIPALRRSLRLSAAARCAPIIGTDLSQDDVKYGFNGGIVRWDAKYLHDQKVIVLMPTDPKAYGNINNYYPSLFFPSPKAGKWQVRPVYAISVRRIPSQRAGYCYSKRVMYIDQESFEDYWNDLYDAANRLWKVHMIGRPVRPIPHEIGLQFEDGNFVEEMWDLQNDHLTAGASSGPEGGWIHADEECRDYEGTDFSVVNKYNTVQALSQVMR